MGDKSAIVAWHDSDLGGSDVVGDAQEYGRVATVGQETPDTFTIAGGTYGQLAV